MSILDVDAAGHYYHSLLKIDKFVKFVGIDATKEYIDYANQIFKKYNNASLKEDIFKISKKHKKDMISLILAIYYSNFQVLKYSIKFN